MSMWKKRARDNPTIEYKISDCKYKNCHYEKSSVPSKNKRCIHSLSFRKKNPSCKLGKRLVASWRTEAKSSVGKDISELKNTHEETDTKIILHSVYAASQGAQTMHIMSQDSDVLVLSVWWSRHLPANTKFVTGVGANKG